MAILKNKLYMYQVFNSVEVVREYPDAHVNLYGSSFSRNDNIIIDRISPYPRLKNIGRHSLRPNREQINNIFEYVAYTNADLIDLKISHSNGKLYHDSINDLMKIPLFQKTTITEIVSMSDSLAYSEKYVKEHLCRFTTFSMEHSLVSPSIFVIIIKIDYIIKNLIKADLSYDKVSIKIPGIAYNRATNILSEQEHNKLKECLIGYFKTQYGLEDQTIHYIISLCDKYRKT